MDRGSTYVLCYIGGQSRRLNYVACCGASFIWSGVFGLADELGQIQGLPVEVQIMIF
jgi:hypothetical protein